MRPSLIDYETRCPLDLKLVGVPKYSLHAEVMAIGYRIGDKPRRVYRPGYDPHPTELLDFLHYGEAPIWAHNAAFEKWISKNATPKILPDWPSPEKLASRWRCSAALARYWGYPGKLETLGPALRLMVKKDTIGHECMLKCSKPDKNGVLKPRPTPEVLAFADFTMTSLRQMGYQGESSECVKLMAETSGVKCQKSKPKGIETAATWWLAYNKQTFTPDELVWALQWAQMFDYCGTDIDTQAAVVESLPPMPDAEWAKWHMDQRINQRGVHVDVKLAESLTEFNRKAIAELADKLPELTGGYVTAPSQRERILDWLNSKTNNAFPSVAKDILEGYLAEHEDDPFASEQEERVIAVINARLQGSKTSASKFESITNRAFPDAEGLNVVADFLMFMAAHTGRWSSLGIQLHNLPQAKLKTVAKNLITEVADLLAIHPESVLRLLSPSPLSVVPTWIRSCFTAGDPRTHEFLVGDFAGIEARGLGWVSGCNRMLQIFHDKRDPYKELASEIYCKPVEEISKESVERKIGKAAVLGLGYNMGAEKFIATVLKAERITLDPVLAKKVVDTYRGTFAEVPRFWWGIEAAAKRAIREPNTVQFCSRIKWRFSGGWLQCLLPSGRTLNYAQASLSPRDGGNGEELRYWGLDAKTNQWTKHHTYGGKLTENIVQAICADLLAEAMLRCEQRGLGDLRLHVHDEIVTRVPKGQFTPHDLEVVMAEQPTWAVGFPIEVEAFASFRYKK